MTDDLYCLQGDDPRRDLSDDAPCCGFCGETEPTALSEWLDEQELRRNVCDDKECIEWAENWGWVKR